MISHTSFQKTASLKVFPPQRIECGTDRGFFYCTEIEIRTEDGSKTTISLHHDTPTLKGHVSYPEGALPGEPVDIY